MQSKAYKTKSGTIRYKPVIEIGDELEDAGFCIACGSETSGVEPDAQRYECDNCGKNMVYGIEELLIMEIAEVTD